MFALDTEPTKATPQIFSEIVRSQKILELFGQKTANDGIKWIPVKVNRRIPVGMPPNIYDFEGVKLVREDGRVVAKPHKDYATPIIGSRAAENEDSPHGFIKVAPTEFNQALLERYAALAGTVARERSKDGGPVVTEIRITVPRYERMDVEDAALMQAIMDRAQSPEMLLRALETAPDAAMDIIRRRLGLPPKAAQPE